MMLQNLLRPLKSIALAWIFGFALLGATSSALAGAGELSALKAALLAQVPSVTDISQATSQQLFDAFNTVVFAVGSKYNTTKSQGVVGGEALKAAGPNAADFGEFFGQKIVAGAATPPLNAIFTDRRNFVALAASTAGSGKGLNVAQIPGLASKIFLGEPTTFTAVALATKAKAGIGAIFGGRARQIFASDATPAATSVAVANSAIFDKKLGAAAQDITQWIAAEFARNAADSAAFAVGVADGNAFANNKLALKIATGAAAGDPTNAGNIVHNLLNQQLLTGTLQTGGMLTAPTISPSAGLLTTMVKKASDIAKKISAVADIEEIQKVGNALGQLMTVPGAKAGTALVSVSKAASFVKTLANAVMSKPRGNGLITDRNRDDNKKDEIAEVAAYMVGGLVGSPEFAAFVTGGKASKAASTLLGIVTSAAGVKPKVVKGVAAGPSPDTFAADVTASVALTVLNSTLDPAIKMAFHDLLLLPDGKGGFKTLTKINKNVAAAIKTALDNVYDGNAANNGGFEDGNSLTGALSDPETDTHPFS